MRATLRAMRSKRRRYYGPTPSVAEPRPVLLAAVRCFVREAARCAGVLRIAFVGSLTTDKAAPKDADVLVTIDAGMELTKLARAGRRLMGQAQRINLGGDIFLADVAGRYLGRICRYRECHPRALCRARHCGLRDHLNDDLDVVTLSAKLIAEPPIELWPGITRRVPVPADVEMILLAQLEDGRTQNQLSGPDKQSDI